MVLNELLTNTVFISAIVAMIFVQILKGVLRSAQNKNFDFSHFLISGGMPSGHSALVSSLAAAIYFQEGVNSVFVLSFFFGLIVIYDAMILRMTVGRNSTVISQMTSKLKIKKADHKLTQSHGHTPAQVIVGIIMGILTAMIVNTL